MVDTSIQWTDATWNPVRGCKEVSPGCTNCYAAQLAHRWSGPGRPYEGLTRPIAGKKRAVWTGEFRPVPDKLEEPLGWKKPRMVFVNSMSDLFGEGVPDDYIAQVFGVMARCPQHTFQVLTKRAALARSWFRWFRGEGRPFLPAGSPWPLPNVWMGFSAEDQERLDKRAAIFLEEIPARVIFASLEPLLGPVDLSRRELLCLDYSRGNLTVGRYLDWVIVGGESGHGSRPCDIGWIRSVVKQCRETETAVFVKQLGAKPHGEWGPGDPPTYTLSRSTDGGLRSETVLSQCQNGKWKLRDPKGGTPSEWPEDLRVREFPR